MRRGRPITNHKRLVTRHDPSFIVELHKEAKERNMSVSKIVEEALRNRMVMVKR